MAADPPGGHANWSRIEALFHDALAKAPGERAPFLDAACAGDDDVRREVSALLDALERDGALLEARGVEVAARLLGESDVVPQEPAARPDDLAANARKPAPLWLYLLSVIFLADCLLRAYCYTRGPDRFGYATRLKGSRAVVTAVREASAAGRAGIEPGDEILAIDGQPVTDAADASVIGWNLEVGRAYAHDVRRGAERRRVDLVVQRVPLLESSAIAVHAVWQIDELFMLATALLIAFARPFDRLARLGALAMATISVGLYFTNMPPGYAAIWRHLPAMLGAFLWVPNLCIFLFAPIVLTFFVQFPRPLFAARWPWLLIWLPAVLLVPTNVIYTFLVVHDPPRALGGTLPGWVFQLQGTLYPVYGLSSLGALAAHYFQLTDINERRRLRIVLVGGALAVLPGLLRWPILILAPESAVMRVLANPVPDVFVGVVFLLFPICLAYSILRHRLFDIRVIVRAGLQYGAAKGLLILAVPALAIGLFIDMLAHGDQPMVAILEDRGWAYGAVALVAVVAHLRRREWGDAIDRRFFRERYDARRVLADVVEDVRVARSFPRAAPGVVGRIAMALHPEMVAVLLRPSGATAFHSIAVAPAPHPPLAVSADSPPIHRLRRQAKPAALASQAAGIDLLVPIVMSAEHDEAMIALGPRRSGDPYTGEDRHLLEAVANGLALLFQQEQLTAVARTSSFEECPECGHCSDSGSGSCALDGAPLTPVPLPRMLGGRYRLERRRGRGGMGTVYEAKDTTLGRKVAVKVVREELVNSAAAARRFSREARVAATFDHANVVTVHDYGIEAGTRAFIVMELLEGATLREELKSRGRLEPARVLEILGPVCEAIGAAHARHLIHRDLKPENIFLCASSKADGESVKILDFGIAKILADAEDFGLTRGATETGVAVLVGTPGYMSPEQILGERPAIGWDLWALAVVAYEMLTGALPFPVTNRESWMRAMLAGSYTPLDQHLEHPPAAWQQFFARSLALERASRPASALQLLDTLQHALT